MVEEEGVRCPRNLKWLRAIHDWMPETIFEASKLGSYLECLKESKAKEGSSQEKA